MLSSIVLVSLGPARKKARDARRVTEINQFGKLFEICYAEKGDYPGIGSTWDEYGTDWQYFFSCGPCYGNFQDAIKQCTTTPIEDPINTDPLAYYYFYFAPDATTYNGTPINNACKGRYALMAHLELPEHENGLCFDEPGLYEYWFILSY